MMPGGMWEATEEKEKQYSIYFSKSEPLLNCMTFRMTPKDKPHESKGKPFCMRLAYPSVWDGQRGNCRSGLHHMNIHLTDGARAADPDQRCTEPEGAQFECPICGITRKTKSKIEKHMSCHDSDEEDSSFLCGDCSYQAMNRDQLLEHLENRHDKHICNSCNIECKSKNE